MFNVGSFAVNYVGLEVDIWRIRAYVVVGELLRRKSHGGLIGNADG